MAKKTSGQRGADVKRSAPGADGLVESALRCFHQYGYAGTSVRQIASDADVTVAALYHHFGSKQEILVSIMTGAMEAALEEVRAAYESAPPDPVEQLRAIVTAMVHYHTRSQREAFVGNSELRSLEETNRRAIVALRDAHEELMRTTVADGVANGSFDVEPLEASRAILAMCIAVASWYQKGGPLTPDDISELYSHYALNLVGFRPGTDGPATSASLESA